MQEKVLSILHYFYQWIGYSTTGIALTVRNEKWPTQSSRSKGKHSACSEEGAWKEVEGGSGWRGRGKKGRGGRSGRGEGGKREEEPVTLLLSTPLSGQTNQLFWWHHPPGTRIPYCTIHNTGCPIPQGTNTGVPYWCPILQETTIHNNRPCPILAFHNARNRKWLWDYPSHIHGYGHWKRQGPLHHILGTFHN